MRRATEEAEMMAGYEVESAYVGIAGSELCQPWQVIEEDLRRQLDAAVCGADSLFEAGSQRPQVDAVRMVA